MKTALKALSAGMLGLSAVAANAQALSPGDPKMLSGLDTLLGPYTTAAKTTDVAVAADGTRYLVGTANDGTQTDGYLTVLTAHGQFVAHATINHGVDDSTVAVAANATGVYVATNAAGTTFVDKYDALGVYQWTETSGVATNVKDMVVNSAGYAICAGSLSGGIAAAIFKNDGTGYLGHYAYTNIGSFTNCALDANGNIWLVGSSALISGQTNTTMGMIAANFGGVSVSGFSSNLVTTQDLAIDPTTQLAIGVGYQVVGSFHRPLRVQGTAVVNPTTSAVTLTLSSSSSNYDTFGGGEWQFVKTNANGNIYLITAGGVSSGSRYLDVYCSKKAATGATLTGIWGDFDLGTSDGSNLVPYGAAITNNNTLSVLARNDLATSDAGGSYKAYNIYTWAGSGTSPVHVHRNILGSSDQPADSVVPTSAIPANTVAYAGSTFSFAGSTTGGVPGSWFAGFVSGPDDTYKINEDVTLSATTPKDNLLTNDQNGWATLSAVLVPGSLVGLDSVTVNPDGTFTAVPTPNFNGTASFMYNSTRKATITVKPINDAPVAVDDDTFTIAMNSSATTFDVLANDTDVDGDSLTLTGKTDPAHGTVKLSPDKLTLTYKPQKNYVGTDTFSYSIKDGHGGVATGHVTIDVQQPS